MSGDSEDSGVEVLGEREASPPARAPGDADLPDPDPGDGISPFIRPEPIDLDAEHVNVGVLEDPIPFEDIEEHPVRSVKGRDGVERPAIYVPWHLEANRLNRAFGIGQWSLIPYRNPGYDDQRNEVIWPGMLFIQGNYVAQAIGTCEWYPDSQMSRGDAQEAAKSNCLSRTCKGIDPGLQEAWKASYIRDYWEWREEEFGPVESEDNPSFPYLPDEYEDSHAGLTIAEIEEGTLLRWGLEHFGASKKVNHDKYGDKNRRIAEACKQRLEELGLPLESSDNGGGISDLVRKFHEHGEALCVYLEEESWGKLGPFLVALATDGDVNPMEGDSTSDVPDETIDSWITDLEQLLSEYGEAAKEKYEGGFEDSMGEAGGSSDPETSESSDDSQPSQDGDPIQALQSIDDERVDVFLARCSGWAEGDRPEWYDDYTAAQQFLSDTPLSGKGAHPDLRERCARVELFDDGMIEQPPSANPAADDPEPYPESGDPEPESDSGGTIPLGDAFTELSEIVVEIPGAQMSAVMAYLKDEGNTRSNFEAVKEHLEECRDGERDFETDDGVVVVPGGGS